jgi:hypothetical protein
MDDFKDLMAQWIELKKHIDVARQDLKVLTQREKELRQAVQVYMKNEDIDTCTTKDAKVVYKTRNVKANFTKDLVRKGLLAYFNGDQARVDYVFDIILKSAEVKEKSSISCKILDP